MSKLSRVTLEELNSLDKLYEKVLQADFLVIVEIHPGRYGYEHLFRRFEEWGVKKIYLEYFESKYLYSSGVSQYQILRFVQKWQRQFPNMSFNILNLQKEARWTGLQSPRGIVLLLKFLLQLGVGTYIAAVYSKFAVIKTIQRLKGNWQNLKISWRKFSFKEHGDRILSHMHRWLRPLKKIYYFLRYLLSKLTKTS